jgi:hypothetical protein
VSLLKTTPDEDKYASSRSSPCLCLNPRVQVRQSSDLNHDIHGSEGLQLLGKVLARGLLGKVLAEGLLGKVLARELTDKSLIRFWLFDVSLSFSLSLSLSLPLFLWFEGEVC